MAKQGSTEVPPEQKDILALNNLALRIYRQLVHAGKEGNIIFSPTTLLYSLQELYLTSHGKSREQIQKLLNFVSDDTVQALFRDLSGIHHSGSAAQNNRVYDFFTTTKILVNHGVRILPKFNEELRNIAGNDGEEVLGFVQADVKAIESLIDQLASEMTHERIVNFGTDQALKMEKDAVLLLSLASFRSDWENKFEERSSVFYEGRNRDSLRALPVTVEDFHNADGSSAKVLMVHLQGKIFLTRDEKLKVTIAELPLTQYTNNLVVVLPDDTGKNGLKNFEDSVKENTFEILRQHWQMPLTHVYLPKFSLENHFSLEKSLMDLGVRDVFSSAKADLSNLSTHGAPHVTGILHAASIGTSQHLEKPLPNECVIA